MGYIKEPKGIDFVIRSEPLTDKAHQEISEFIRNYKKKATHKKAKSNTASKQPKSIHA
ncbi:hypothetical protein FHK02_5828 [Spirosoma sp. LMG 31448]|uniref:Uncharacterized protein n=1 Tax=Spirosoma utsteinense TaxID=2585773 RepID=A0ABR6WF47_9BACT|nr:hypothetical protein [Spirosoma utsteinense]MBC3795168.1 hypothetical protein [Spirosoma utsteinense]